MERHPKINEKILFGDGFDFMIIKRGFDEKACERIARASGSKAVKSTIAWLRRANYHNPEKFVCEIIDDCAFYAATICKKHLRLYEIAVDKSKQRIGLGSALMSRMRSLCIERGLQKITLRTAKDEDAIKFYQRHGGYIVGEKDNDWEVEIRI